MEKIEIVDFKHGANTTDAAHEILDTQTPDCQNVDLSLKGKVTTRDGSLKINATAIATATGIYGAGYFKSKHICAALTDLYQLTAGEFVSFQSSLTSNAQTYFNEWNNYVGIVNGAETPMKWSGSQVTAIGGAPTEWTSVKPNFICDHDNRWWTLTASSSQLHWSVLDNGENWTTTDNAGKYSFSPNDGFTGTGIVSQQGGLVVFKQQGIYKVVGKTPITFSFPSLYKTVGCIAPRTIINIDNRIFFLARYRGDYAVMVLDDSGKLTHISKDITTTLNTIITTNANLASAGAYKEKYVLSFPITGGYKTVNVNYTDGTWEIDSGNSASCHYNASDSFYGGSFTAGTVNQIGTGTADNTTAITSYIKTKNYLLNGADYTKKLRYLIIWAKTSGTWNIDINLYIDDKLHPEILKIPLGPRYIGETTRREVIPINADVQGNMIAIKFGTSTINQPFELYRAELYYDVLAPEVK